MCDYSLHSVASRPAKVGDRLVTTRFSGTETCGFAAVDEPTTAVCLLPGTEVVFEREVEFIRPYGRLLFWLRPIKVGHNAARFRHVNHGRPYVHRDALEFPDGQTVLVTRLRPGQHATVIQLPAPRAAARPSVTVDSEALQS